MSLPKNKFGKQQNWTFFNYLATKCHLINESEMILNNVFDAEIFWFFFKVLHCTCTFFTLDKKNTIEFIEMNEFNQIIKEQSRADKYQLTNKWILDIIAIYSYSENDKIKIEKN